MRLDDPRDRERVTDRLERDLVIGPETRREELQRLRVSARGAHLTAPPSAIATSQKSR